MARFVRFLGLSALALLVVALTASRNRQIKSDQVLSPFHRSLQQSQSSVVLPPILSNHKTENRPNAIVYLAQKKHSSYDRDSYGLLLKSLDLLYENYLLIDNHYQQAHIYIFHTGDFDLADLQTLESRFPEYTHGTIQLVNLAGTEFWHLPEHLREDDQTSWKGAWAYAIGTYATSTSRLTKLSQSTAPYASLLFLFLCLVHT